MLSVNAVNMFMEESKLMKERERTPKVTKQSRKRVPKGNTPSKFIHLLLAIYLQMYLDQKTAK